MKLSAQLKTILFIVGITFVLGMGAGVGIYTAIFKPHPKIETISYPVETTIPEIKIELEDSKIADIQVVELPPIKTEFPQLDTLYSATFKVKESDYFGSLDVVFSLKRKLFTYNLALTVKEREIFIEVPVDVPVYRINKTKFLSAFAGGGVGFDFVNDKPDINYGNIKVGVAIKKTVLFYIQIDTNEVFSINGGVIF